MDAIRGGERYTYADYAAWNDGKRWELIDGVPYEMTFTAMAPAPGYAHQSAVGELFAQMHGFLRGKPCKAFIAPFDVRLDAGGEDDTVVQPDIVVVCDRSKLDEKGCNGAPDLIVEVLSPSTAGHDKLVKFNKYLQAGVREYWIVDPDTKTASVHILKDGEYVVGVYGEEDSVNVNVLEGCAVSLAEVFAE